MHDGMVESKFSPNKNNDNLYMPPSWLTKIEFIQQLIFGTNVLISVLAEKGGGKTSFINLMQAHLDKDIKISVVSASPLFDKNLFISRLNHNDDTLNTECLENVMCKKHTQEDDSHTLVIVDDAQYLPDTLIEEMLQTMQRLGLKSHFHFCLVSDASLTPRLQSFETQFDDLIHSIELGGLGIHEVKGYLMHQLLSHPSFLNDKRVQQFYDLTDGSLVGMNTQMTSFFNLERLQRELPWYERKVFQRLAAMTVMGMALLGVLLIMQPNTLEQELAQEVTQVKTPTVEPIINQQPTLLSAALISQVPSFDVAAYRQDLQVINSTPIDSVAQNEGYNVPSKNTPLLVKKTASVQKEKTLDATTVRQRPIQPNELAHQNSSIMRVASSKPTNVSSHYTIQLLASQKSSELKRFAQAHHLKGKAQVLRAKKNQRMWYVLVFGEYEHKELAQQALHELPHSLAKFHPWIRTFNELQRIG